LKLDYKSFIQDKRPWHGSIYRLCIKNNIYATLTILKISKINETNKSNYSIAHQKETYSKLL